MIGEHGQPMNLVHVAMVELSDDDDNNNVTHVVGSRPWGWARARPRQRAISVTVPPPDIAVRSSPPLLATAPYVTACSALLTATSRFTAPLAPDFVAARTHVLDQIPRGVSRQPARRPL